MQILIGQLVNVMKNGKPVRMSKRAGNVVTIDDLVEAVGVDAARYSLARTDYNTSVDIDLDLLTSHSNENPVYYVQYAHARSCNVDRNAAAAGIGAEGADLSLLDTEADGEVLAALAQWPATLALAGDQRAPHKVAHYLEDLAGAYHKWYNVERVVPMALTDPEELARHCASPRTPNRHVPPHASSSTTPCARSSPPVSTCSASPPPTRCDLGCPWSRVARLVAVLIQILSDRASALWLGSGITVPVLAQWHSNRKSGKP